MRLNAFITAFASATLLASSAFSGTTENLQSCLKANTTAEDRKLITKYVYFTLSKHPDFAPYSKIQDAERLANNQALSRYMTRLMAKNCVNEIRTSYLEGDKQAIGTAFVTAFKGIGEQGMVDIMNDKDVVKESMAFGAFVNSDEIGRALISGAK